MNAIADVLAGDYSKPAAHEFAHQEFNWMTEFWHSIATQMSEFFNGVWEWVESTMEDIGRPFGYVSTREKQRKQMMANSVTDRERATKELEQFQAWEDAKYGKDDDYAEWRSEQDAIMNETDQRSKRAKQMAFNKKWDAHKKKRRAEYEADKKAAVQRNTTTPGTAAYDFQQELDAARAANKKRWAAEDAAKEPIQKVNDGIVHQNGRATRIDGDDAGLFAKTGGPIDKMLDQNSATMKSIASINAQQLNVLVEIRNGINALKSEGSELSFAGGNLTQEFFAS